MRKFCGFVGLASVLSLCGLSGLARAQQYTVSFDTPTLDRWMYPFNSTPGIETTIPTFGAILVDGFDDRDGQFLLGFDTPGQVPTGLDASRYVINSMRVTAYISANNQWQYDPSYDAVSTLYPTTDPDYTPDADVNNPVELYAAGYRNGQSAATFTETSAYSTVPPIPPVNRVRSVFAAVYDTAGNATDVSDQVRDRFDTTPMATGQNPALTAGQAVPDGTPLYFDVNVSDPATQAYLARGLSEGRIRVIITSFSPASGQGGPNPMYPAFYSKENALAPVLGYAAKLNMDVTVTGPTCDPDVNQDGVADQGDVDYLINVIAGGENPNNANADFNNDGVADQGDVDALINVIAGGACP
ncbi:MAG: hypothetical protein GC200_11400 [Tepidisphaera sp.]|nr:hypothetical protein [Tepidisphaera sp.]